jgi:hypothetical protein
MTNTLLIEKGAKDMEGLTLSVVKMLHDIKSNGDLNKYMSSMFYELRIAQVLKNDSASELLKYMGISVVGSSVDEVIIEDGEYTASIKYQIINNKRFYDFNSLSLV